MADSYDSDAMAAGYAQSRPPVHERILERAFPRLGLLTPVARALDVGCGSGVSTRALRGFAIERLGIEPVAAMVEWCAAVDPDARFTVSPAESLPVPDQSMDLVTAAGSLNYVDLHRFFPEANRVLAPGGRLLVYDFSTGYRLRGQDNGTEWFAEFVKRYPWPPAESTPLDPERLAAQCAPLMPVAAERFEIGVPLEPEFYLRYLMTETNVAHAIRRGIPSDEIRSWCEAAMTPWWRGQSQEVLFEGYWAAFRTAPADSIRVTRA